MSLAYRNLLKDKTRMTLSIGGVALAMMLILVLNGFLDGMYRQITSYLDRSPGQMDRRPRLPCRCATPSGLSGKPRNRLS